MDIAGELLWFFFWFMVIDALFLDSAIIKAIVSRIEK